MKQIFNWTVGSFFRTIGRTIAVLMLGGLFYYILSTNGFDFGIKDLFFDSVSASEFHSIDQVYYNGNGQAYTNYNYMPNYYYGFSATLGNNPIAQGQYSFYLKQNKTNVDIGTTNIIHGSIFFDNEDQLYTFQYDNGNDEGNIYPNNNNFYILAYFNSGKFTLCQAIPSTSQLWSFSCGVPDGANALNRFTVYFTVTNPLLEDNVNIRIGILSTITLEKTDGTTIVEQQQQTTDAITNQTQQQQQQHQQMMDNNTTQAESDAEGFFGNFTTPDVGGLSAIITAPLNTIRSLLNSQCTNLVLPLPFVDEDITLPCMNEIYTQHFGAFFTIYQTIVLALIAYRCIRSIFFDIHGFTNPDDDRIEVMDL